MVCLSAQVFIQTFSSESKASIIKIFRPCVLGLVKLMFRKAGELRKPSRF